MSRSSARPASRRSSLRHKISMTAASKENISENLSRSSIQIEDSTTAKAQQYDDVATPRSDQVQKMFDEPPTNPSIAINSIPSGDVVTMNTASNGTTSSRHSRSDSGVQGTLSPPKRSSSFRSVLSTYYKIFGGSPKKPPKNEKLPEEADRLRKLVKKYEAQLEEASNILLLQDKVIARWEKGGIKPGNTGPEIKITDATDGTTDSARANAEGVGMQADKPLPLIRESSKETLAALARSSTPKQNGSGRPDLETTQRDLLAAQAAATKYAKRYEDSQKQLGRTSHALMSATAAKDRFEQELQRLKEAFESLGNDHRQGLDARAAVDRELALAVEGHGTLQGQIAESEKLLQDAKADLDSRTRDHDERTAMVTKELEDAHASTAAALASSTQLQAELATARQNHQETSEAHESTQRSLAEQESLVAEHVQKLEQMGAEHAEAIAEVESRLSASTADNQTIREQLETLEAEHEVLQQKHAEIVGTLEAVQTQAAAATATISDEHKSALEKLNADLESAKAQALDSSTGAENLIRAHQSSITALESQLDEQKSASAALQDDIKSSQDKIVLLEQDLATARSEHEAAGDEHAKARSELEAAASENATLEARVQTLIATAAEHEVANAKVAHELDQVKLQLEEKSTKQSELESQLASLTTEAEQHNTMKEDLESSRGRIIELEANQEANGALKIDLDAAQARVQELEAAASAQIIELEAASKQTRELESKMEDLATVKADLQTAEARIAHLEPTIKALEDQQGALDDAQAKISSLSKEVEDQELIRKDVVSAREQIVELEKALETGKLNYDNLQQKLTNVEATLASGTNDLDRSLKSLGEKEKELAEALLQIEKHQETSTQQLAQIEEGRMALSKAQENVAEGTRVAQDLQAERLRSGALEDELASWRQKHDTEVSAHQSKSSELLRLQDEVATWKEKHDMSATAHSMTNEQLAKLQQENSALQQQLALAHEQEELAQSSIEKLRAQLLTQQESGDVIHGQDRSLEPEVGESKDESLLSKAATTIGALGVVGAGVLGLTKLTGEEKSTEDADDEIPTSPADVQHDPVSASDDPSNADVNHQSDSTITTASQIADATKTSEDTEITAEPQTSSPLPEVSEDVSQVASTGAAEVDLASTDVVQNNGEGSEANVVSGLQSAEAVEDSALQSPALPAATSRAAADPAEETDRVANVTDRHDDAEAHATSHQTLEIEKPLESPAEQSTGRDETSEESGSTRQILTEADQQEQADQVEAILTSEEDHAVVDNSGSVDSDQTRSGNADAIPALASSPNADIKEVLVSDLDRVDRKHEKDGVRGREEPQDQVDGSSIAIVDANVHDPASTNGPTTSEDDEDDPKTSDSKEVSRSQAEDLVTEHVITLPEADSTLSAENRADDVVVGGSVATEDETGTAATDLSGVAVPIPVSEDFGDDVPSVAQVNISNTPKIKCLTCGDDMDMESLADHFCTPANSSTSTVSGDVKSTELVRGDVESEVATSQVEAQAATAEDDLQLSSAVHPPAVTEGSLSEGLNHLPETGDEPAMPQETAPMHKSATADAEASPTMGAAADPTSIDIPVATTSMTEKVFDSHAATSEGLETATNTTDDDNPAEVSGKTADKALATLESSDVQDADHDPVPSDTASPAILNAQEPDERQDAEELQGTQTQVLPEVIPSPTVIVDEIPGNTIVDTGGLSGEEATSDVNFGTPIESTSNEPEQSDIGTESSASTQETTEGRTLDSLNVTKNIGQSENEVYADVSKANADSDSKATDTALTTKQAAADSEASPPTTPLTPSSRRKSVRWEDLEKSTESISMNGFTQHLESQSTSSMDVHVVEDKLVDADRSSEPSDLDNGEAMTSADDADKTRHDESAKAFPEVAAADPRVETSLLVHEVEGMPKEDTTIDSDNRVAEETAKGAVNEALARDQSLESHSLERVAQDSVGEPITDQSVVDKHTDAKISDEGESIETMPGATANAAASEAASVADAPMEPGEATISGTDTGPSEPKPFEQALANASSTQAMDFGPDLSGDQVTTTNNEENVPPVAPAPALETTTAPGALALTTPTPATDSVDTDLSPNTAAVGDIVVDAADLPLEPSPSVKRSEESTVQAGEEVATKLEPATEGPAQPSSVVKNEVEASVEDETPKIDSKDGTEPADVPSGQEKSSQITEAGESTAEVPVDAVEPQAAAIDELATEAVVNQSPEAINTVSALAGSGEDPVLAPSSSTQAKSMKEAEKTGKSSSITPTSTIDHSTNIEATDEKAISNSEANDDEDGATGDDSVPPTPGAEQDDVDDESILAKGKEALSEVKEKITKSPSKKKKKGKKGK